MPDLISVVLTTYNWPEALGVSLKSFAEQSYLGFEIVVADDGSSSETARIIRAHAASTLTSLVHAWQADGGFRPTRARSLAVHHTNGDYIILVDGDCFVLPNFIATQRRLAQKRYFVFGKRCYLKRNLSGRILRRIRMNSAPRWRYPPWPPLQRTGWISRAVLTQCTRPFEFLPRRDGSWRYKQKYEWEGVQTCNFGLWKSDFEAINGFENGFLGHGLEDSDLVVRPLRAGVHRKLGNRSSPVLHLWHTRPGGEPIDNLSLFKMTLSGTGASARNGYCQFGVPDGN